MPTNPPRTEELEARLRAYRAYNAWGDPCHHTICDEAAEALAILRSQLSEKEAEIGRLKEALEPFCEFADIEDVPAAMIEINDFRNEDGVSYFAIARTALSKEGGR